jgi:sec-independent protein translocase protein TatB
MFDFSGGELAIIAIVALVAIGPKELPGVLRMVGQWVGKARRMAREFQDQFQEALREAEMADLKKQFDETVETATSREVFDGTTRDIKEALSADPSSAPVTQAESPAVETSPPESTTVAVDAPKPVESEPVQKMDQEGEAARTGTHS